MFELDFCGFASLPGSAIAECMDAAGIDAGLQRHGHAARSEEAPSCSTDLTGNPD